MFEEGDAAADTYRRHLYADIIYQIDTRERAQQHRKRYIGYIKWAAAAVIFAGIATLLYRPKPAIRLVKKETKATNSLVTITNKSGNKKEVYLTDGSQVALYPGSEISYNKVHVRDVYLKGKGFFKVVHNQARPFTVFSHDIATTVLGTSFTITAYPAKSNVTVALHTGKVVVKSNKGKEVYLLPGQQVSFTVMAGKEAVQQPVMNTVADEPAATTISAGSRTGYVCNFEAPSL